jgi:hypothetical protein
MRTGDEGQISVDFLLGLGIFMLTLGFVIQFIPGLFLTITGEGNLNSVAYRTANILVEDPGWWRNSTQNGTDWEDPLRSGNIIRIGLAADASPNTRLTQTPNMLNRTKIQKLNASNESTVTSKLGLYDVISSSQIDYGYNITIEKNGVPMVSNGTPVLSVGKIIPAYQDVFKITRIVLVENGIMAGFRAEELTKSTTNQTARINITGPQTRNVSIQISNLTQNSNFIGAYLNRTLNISSDFIARKETIEGDVNSYSGPLNETDLLLLEFNSSLFTNNTTIYPLDLNFTNMNFTRSGPPYSDYASRVEPLYEPAALVVKVWK